MSIHLAGVTIPGFAIMVLIVWPALFRPSNTLRLHDNTLVPEGKIAAFHHSHGRFEAIDWRVLK